MPRAVLSIPTFTSSNARGPSNGLLIWEHHPSAGSTDTELYLDLLLTDGNRGWGPNGRVLAGGPGTRRDVVADLIGPWVPFDMSYGAVVIAYVDDSAGGARRIRFKRQLIFSSGVGFGSDTASVVADAEDGTLRLAGDVGGDLFTVGWIGSDERIHLQNYTVDMHPYWPSPVSVGPPTGIQSGMYLCPAGLSGWYVYWLQSTPGSPDTTYDLRVQHLTYQGTPISGWPAAGLIVTAAGNGAPTLLPCFMADRAGTGGGAPAVVWRSVATGDLYAQFLLWSASLPPWGPFTLCATPVEKTFVAASLDPNSGGLAVTWLDRRSGDADVYAQYLAGSSSAPAWGSSGMAVAVGPGDQVPASIVAERSGGAMVSWTDEAQGGTPYAQRLTLDGSPYLDWPPSGIVLCDAPEAQRKPLLISDDFDGAMAVWTDMRDSTTNGSDVYAQMVGGSGRLAAGVPKPRGAKVSLSVARPNPTRGQVLFQLELPSPATVSAGIYDIAGREVADLHRGPAAAGVTMLTWDSAGSRAGVYWLRVVHDGRGATRGFVVLP